MSPISRILNAANPDSVHANAQRSLSQGLRIPVLGALIVSPIKLALGAVQATAGLVILVAAKVLKALLEIISALIEDPAAPQASKVLRKINKAFDHLDDFGKSGLSVGLIAIIYSVANIATLGFLGLKIEGRIGE